MGDAAEAKREDVRAPGPRWNRERLDPDRSAVERDLYAQDVGRCSPDLAVEALLSVIEQYSVNPLKALAAAPTRISDEDRSTLALFIAYQQARTPPALAQHKVIVHTAARMSMLEGLSDSSQFAVIYRNSKPEATDEAVETVRLGELEAWRRGDRNIIVPKGAVLEVGTTVSTGPTATA